MGWLNIFTLGSTLSMDYDVRKMKLILESLKVGETVSTTTISTRIKNSNKSWKVYNWYFPKGMDDTLNYLVSSKNLKKVGTYKYKRLK